VDLKNLHDAPSSRWKRPQVTALMQSNSIYPEGGRAGTGRSALRCFTPALTGFTATQPVPSFSVLALGGKPPYTFGVYVGPLPANLTLNTATGLISGIPLTPGAYYVRFYVTDSVGTNALSSPVTIVVNPSPSSGSAPSLRFNVPSNTQYAGIIF
jgi:hypothetical protein